MKEKAINLIKKYNMIKENSNVIIGLSGGADSVSLFHLLLGYKKKVNFNLIPVHINHGIRGEESRRDESFVLHLCKSYNLECKVYRCNISELSKKFKISEEEAGRKYRYESFRKEFISGEDNVIAVAHTKDDQSETILMRMFRGSGLKGLCGIDLVNNNIIRPLLTTTRLEVEKYCRHNNLNFIIDSSNEKKIYTRNKIRLELIPYIKKNFNENIVDTLCRTSDIIREEHNYIDTVVEEKFAQLVEKSENDIILNKTLLKNNHIVIVKRIVRKAFLVLNKNLVDINMKHIYSVIGLINGESGKKIDLPFDVTVRVSYDRLIFSKKSVGLSEKKGFCYKLKENEITYVKEANFYVTISTEELANVENKINSYTKIFYYDSILDDFCIRSRQRGDKIYLNHIKGSKKIKNYFIDEKVDVELRDSIPLLTLKSDVLWIFDKNNLTSDMYVEDNKNKIIIQLWEDSNEKRD